MQDYTLTQNFHLQSLFKAFCLINFCTLSIYLRFGDSQLTFWLFFSVMEIFVDFLLYMEYNTYRKFK